MLDGLLCCSPESPAARELRPLSRPVQAPPAHHQGGFLQLATASPGPDGLEQGVDVITSVLVLLGVGGAVIGFLLAVLGAGGSILLMPLLISGAALPTREAVPLSLLVVTLMALGNLGPYLRRRQVAPKPALILGVPALVGSWIGGSFVKAGQVSEPVQLGVFAAAALLAAWLLTRRRATGQVAARREVGSLLLLGSQGVLIGLLTGIAGVGGGFAIVPALVLLAGLPMPLASGTSLLLIAINSLVAMAALGHWPAASLPLMLPLLLGGFVGAVIGQRLAPHLPDRQLRRGFAALLIGSALLTGGEAWRRQSRTGHQALLISDGVAESRQLAVTSPYS
ncbi:sulfite exporter TauE/SafE family protein [Synechococcus sp. CS-1326]|uniref:sulfite exporter TauE/SafE family protein n=1 Tax=Synechococcus sp. CS-1326 TaxID=2847978 RepID=UPI00223B2E16|nr:sulfite exporter TauE/SafE family protein [Synechococcus sp. CS-1326]